MKEFDQEKIAHKIRALMAKAEDNAATEAEAISAAEKAKELLDKYQLDLGSVQLVNDGFETLKSSNQDDESSHIHDSLAYFISQYTDTMAWNNQNAKNGLSECRYFGLKTDVYFAVWLSQSLEKFIIRRSETVKHLGEDYYNSFRDGILNGINSKLQSACERNHKKRPKNHEPEEASGGEGSASSEAEQDHKDNFNSGVEILDKIGIVKTEAQKRFRLSGDSKKTTVYKSNIGAFLSGRTEGKAASLAQPLGNDKDIEQLEAPLSNEESGKPHLSEREKERLRREARDKE